MILMDFDKLAAELTSERLKQFNSKIRRQVLLKVGNAAAKPLVAAVKAEPVPNVSGTLAKEVGKKVKAYAAGNVVFVVVGAKSKKILVNAYEYQRKEKRNAGRKATGPRKSSMKVLNPVHYGHLAGPGRHSDLIQRVRSRMKSATVETVRQVLQTEVAKL